MSSLRQLNAGFFAGGSSGLSKAQFGTAFEELLSNIEREIVKKVFDVSWTVPQLQTELSRTPEIDAILRCVFDKALK